MKNILLLSIIIILVMTGCSEDTIGEEFKGSVTGLVLSKSTGEPIENAEITTNPASTTVFTDEEGKFLLENILVNSYSVKAEADGYVTSFKGVAVTTGDISNVVIEMTEGIGNNRAPSPPELISPEDNAQGQSLELDLIWEASDPEGDTLTFEVEIRNNRNDEILKYGNIQDTIFRLTDLNYGFKYFWQVRVSDSINSPVMSEVRSFSTLNHAGSRIFYTKEINGNQVIFGRDVNDNEYQLTSPSVNSFRPRKNNSTEKIAFLQTVGGQTHLFTMNQDGSQQSQVTSNIPVNGFNLDQLDYSWANDGASLVYPNFGNLFRINVTGGGNTLIYEAPEGRFITEVDVSEDNSLIALLTNNSRGYDASIYTINLQGTIVDKVIEGLPGALGGLNLSVDKKYLLYTRDVSGYESTDYRRLNSRMFIYNFSNKESRDISWDKLDGTNDLDPRFSPDEAQVIFVNTSNDGISRPDIYRARFAPENAPNINERELLYENAIMPDWE